MITFSNGHQFQFMTASGALAFDGRGWPWEWPLRWTGLLEPELFTIVIKTLTRHPRPGNLRWSHPWSVVKSLGSEGVVNAIGLTNKGIDWWIREVAPKIPDRYAIVASIEANDELEVVEMIQLLEGQNIKGIELNLSCPNTKEHCGRTAEKILAICRHAARASYLPLIAKLSYTHDYVEIAQELAKEKKMEAIAINSVPWAALFPEKPSPLARFGGGGVSGKIVQEKTWKMIEELSAATTIPVIGPSVWEYDDVEKIFKHGARAVSFGSVFVRHPWRPTLFARRWIKEKRIPRSDHNPST